jgi:hypothetical protein
MPKMGPLLDDKEVEAVSNWVVRNRARIQMLQQKGYDSDSKRKGLVATEDSAIDEALQILRSPSDPRHQAFLQMIANEGAMNAR